MNLEVASPGPGHVPPSFTMPPPERPLQRRSSRGGAVRRRSMTRPLLLHPAVFVPIVLALAIAIGASAALLRRGELPRSPTVPSSRR